MCMHENMQHHSFLMQHNSRRRGPNHRTMRVSGLSLWTSLVSSAEYPLAAGLLVLFQQKGIHLMLMQTKAAQVE